MDSFIPHNVNDTSAFRHWCNKLVDWCKRNTLRSSEDIKVTQTTQGTTLEISNKIKQKLGGQSSAPGVNVGAVWL